MASCCVLAARPPSPMESFPFAAGAAWLPGRWCQSTADLGSPGSAISGWAVVWSMPDRAGSGRTNIAPFRPGVSFSVQGRLGWGVWLPIPHLQAVGASMRHQRRLARVCLRRNPFALTLFERTTTALIGVANTPGGVVRETLSLVWWFRAKAQ
jgi:hypothetical protein